MKHVLLVTLFLIASCATEAPETDASNHYFWRPASEGGAERPWAVLLPGSGGMSIFDDDGHYFRAAAWLNERGVDALIVDYHGAARFVRDGQDGSPGDRMAAIVANAAKVQRAMGRMSTNCPGIAIGWSLGAEGTWAIAAQREQTDGIRAAVMFYPTVRILRPYSNVIPILVLQGATDNVTPELDLREFVAARPPESAVINVVVLAAASHGFDVRSITQERTMRFPPLIGPQATFGYSAEATARAQAALDDFLSNQGISRDACTGTTSKAGG